MNESDLVFYTDDKKNIFSCGYDVNSVFLKLGISPIKTIQNKDTANNLFENLVVPNWSIYQKGVELLNNTELSNVNDTDTDTFDNIEENITNKVINCNVIGDDMIDRLLILCNEGKTKKQNRTKNKRNKKTKTISITSNKNRKTLKSKIK